MIQSDSRGARLRAFDAKLIEFVTDSEHAHGDGGASLCELAKVIASSMARWKKIMPRIALVRPGRFDAEMAGALAIESVFDELLDEPSLGLLVAAFELAVSTR